MTIMHGWGRFSPIAVITTATLLLAACGTGISSPSSSEQGSPLPTATLTPSVAATPSSTASTSSPMPTGGIAPDSLALVVTNDLVVRSLPEISDRSTIDPVFLQDGQLMFVLEGPVRADGYDWYRVATYDPPDDTPPEPGPLLGWVAAGGKDGEPWIEATTANCETEPGNPNWRPSVVALACIGDREVSVAGTLAGCAGIVPGDVEPTWLAEGGCELVPDAYVPGDLGSINFGFHLAPDGPLLPGPDASIRIVGHMDDPAAATCQQVRQAGAELPPEIVVLRCRAAFVVTEITPR